MKSKELKFAHLFKSVPKDVSTIIAVEHKQIKTSELPMSFQKANMLRPFIPFIPLMPHHHLFIGPVNLKASPSICQWITMRQQLDYQHWCTLGLGPAPTAFHALQKRLHLWVRWCETPGPDLSRSSVAPRTSWSWTCSGLAAGSAKFLGTRILPGTEMNIHCILRLLPQCHNLFLTFVLHTHVYIYYNLHTLWINNSFLCFLKCLAINLVLDLKLCRLLKVS